MNSLPSWAGTLPQWAMFITLAVAFVKLYSPMLSDATGLRKEVKDLHSELNKCEEECRADIKKLQEEIWGMRKQHIAEQISLINIILKTTDAPELHGLLAVLEDVKLRLAVAAIAKETEDADRAER